VDFLGGLGVEVIGGLIVASLVGLATKLRTSSRRKKIAEQLRRRFCRHDWRRPSSNLGGGYRFVPVGWQEECAKCGARR